MGRTPVEPAASPVAHPESARPRSQTRRRRRRRGPRLWYLPLLLAVLLPLVAWAGLNAAFVWFSVRDLGPLPEPTPTAVPADAPLLSAAIALVQGASCAPGTESIGGQTGYASARWSALRSAVDDHAYYVAAADPTTDELRGIWQLEGGQVTRLQDNRCPGITVGTPARLAEAAVLFSPHHASQ